MSATDKPTDHERWPRFFMMSNALQPRKNVLYISKILTLKQMIIIGDTWPRRGTVLFPALLREFTFSKIPITTISDLIDSPTNPFKTPDYTM